MPHHKVSVRVSLLVLAGALSVLPLHSQNPSQGPGGPILIISSSANPFTSYYAEILRAEGLNLFAVADISTISAATLASFDLVITGQMPLTPAQVALLSNWVNAGGNLIAMRPDKQLSGLLGLADAGSTLSNGYINVNTSNTPGYGIVGRTMQFHGTADLYTPAGASAIATLYSTAAAATPYPAVTWRSVGAGTAAAFTYDLARSVVHTRQGNPAWSGQQRDPSTFSSSPNAPYNLYFGPAPFDPQPSWVDFNMIAVPQADEQQRLLANLIIEMNLNKRPLPRFWYFPFGFSAAVVMTGDDHANGGTAGRFDGYKAASNPGCSVANWECIRSTSNVYPNSPLTNAQAAGYVADGFEVGLHVTTNCAPWTPATLDSFFVSQLILWSVSYPSVPRPATNRTHCVVWSDYATQPRVELSHGMRLDTTYDYWPATWMQDRPGLFTGSGMPMRFADVDGSMIDVYQAATYISDRANQSEPLHIDALLDQATGPSGYYGAFTVLMHTDQVTSFGSDVVIASAKGHGVPVISARQLLTWLDGRNNSYFGSLMWSGNSLQFTIAAGQGTNGIQAMLPRNSGAGALTGLFLNGTPVAFTVKMIKGVEYAFFNAAAGSYQAIYGAPAAIGVVVSPASLTLSASQSQQFAVTVTGSWNVGVNWTINPLVGSISSGGLYTAPAAITSFQNVTITATSAADAGKSASVVITLSPSAPLPPPPAPDGYWNFDYSYVIGSLALDKSSNNMVGTISGGVTPVSGKVGQALSFNGANGSISVADAYPITQLYTNLTMAAWIRTSNSSRYEAILSKYDAGGLESGYLFRTDPAGHVGVRIGSNNIMFGVGSNVTDTGAPINDGQWHHVAAVITLGQGVQFYIDGSPSSNQPRNIITYPFGAPFQIGLSSYAPYGNYFTGSIDDVRFYRQALSSSQIGQLANVTNSISVSLSPLAANLSASQAQQFTATVVGSPNSAVIWSLNPTVGTLSSGGLYTAPPAITGAQNVTVTATSAADATKFARATITLTPGVVTVSVTPATVTLNASQSQQFSASVTGTNNTAVTWSAGNGPGTISSTGLYTAPVSVPGSLTVTVTATSAADPTKSATAAITLTPVTISVSPATVSLAAGQAQQFNATVTGTGNTTVTWSIGGSPGTISATGLYTAPASILSSQAVTVTATSAADPTKSANATITLSPTVITLPAAAGYWSFDSSYVIGGVVFDQSGNSMLGLISGGVTAIVGIVNQALNFDGINGCITIGNDYPFGQLYGNRTFAAWIKTLNNTRYEAILSKFDAGGLETGYIFRTDPSGHLQFRIGSNNLQFGIGSNVIDTGAVINNGVWHHVAVVITLGSIVQFYVDGALSSTQPSNTILTPIGAQMKIGMNPYLPEGNYFTGGIDEVRLYTQALTASQIAALASGH